MKSIHVEGPQTCSVCGRISTNMKALAKHKKIHLEGSKERFKCIVCGKGFRDRTKLKVHILQLLFRYLILLKCRFFFLQEHSYIHSGVTDGKSAHERHALSNHINSNFQQIFQHMCANFVTKHSASDHRCMLIGKKHIQMK